MKPFRGMDWLCNFVNKMNGISFFLFHLNFPTRLVPTFNRVCWGQRAGAGGGSFKCCYWESWNRESLLKGKSRYSWPPCTNKFWSDAFDIVKSTYFFTNQAPFVRASTVVSLSLHLAFPAWNNNHLQNSVDTLQSFTVYTGLQGTSIIKHP